MELLVTGRRLWESEAIWRFVDVLAPRGFGFILHTWLLWHFGADAYALPAWIIATFGLIASLIPDPSGYVLLAGHFARARLRARLLSSWVWGKTLIGASCSLLVLMVFANPLLAELPPHANVLAIIGGSLLFAVSETLWAVCNLNRFAMGQLVPWARWGVLLRVAGLGGAITLGGVLDFGIGGPLLIFSLPLAVVSLLSLPAPVLDRRSLIAGVHALRCYSLWTQLNGFLLSLLMQAPVFFAGANVNLTPALIGQLAYAVRVLNFLVQPLMVLQSIVVRDYARLRSVTRSLNLYRLLYRLSGGVILASTALLAWFFSEIRMMLLFFGLGLAFFSIFRFEFALLNALRDVRFLSLRVFLPVAVFFGLAVLPFRQNLTGVALVITVAHILLTLLLLLQVRRRIAFSGDGR
ncbi:MAG: hypothetical protein CMO06_12850 [Thalassospira sp.]|nr:hypothetical protein [Thalassospira sp.]